ncbi:hypothetical protein [Falsiroseomonas tokyonensis]|uniref:Uncharacterized protein n=1 Tax=Falsiroseomonas tokyonensis TaxID=430521 RepID=A0ABV7BZE8_9PROT|nr:hypothetical protein [Falsiroseomonas tokyonensis]MBU8540040.1 hypothetical protein [Falsiroseomonas tokyonensis]
MAARKQRPARPVDAAITRLLALAGKGAVPGRMAREVELIAGEWRAAPEADVLEIRERLDELREQLTAGVGHAEEQVADLDSSEPGAMKQAGAMLAALVATRDATTRALGEL